MKTSIYLVCFHSHDREPLEACSGQYLTVEQAIHRGEWPYDNGDDPSFFVARSGGPLTWGVCRQNLRTALRLGSIVVFFSFTPEPNDDIVYRLCAVSTVVDKLDHRTVHRDKRFTKYRKLYINGLIAPVADGWHHSESDRPEKRRHNDWLWRITDHGQMTRERFDTKFKSIYEKGWFSEVDIGSALRLGQNCILFSKPPDRAYISPNPPEVARFSGGQHEHWSDQTLKELTVIEAARHHKRGRDFLRINNSSGRNVHRHLRFSLPVEEANRWRDQLTNALKGISSQRHNQGHSSSRTGEQARLPARRGPRC